MKAWQAGDWAVFPITYMRKGELRRQPRTGQIVRVVGTALIVQVDGEEIPRLWGIPSRRDDAKITQWRATLSRYIHQLRRSHMEQAGIDYALFQQGPAIMGRILAALCSDGRFIEWEGRWFLQALIEYPDASQLVTLARTLLAAAPDSARLPDLLADLAHPEADDASTLFGFALAMSECPDLFSRVENGRHTRWILASPSFCGLRSQVCSVRSAHL